MKVQGNTKNIKHYIIDQLETIYEMQVPIGQISTNEINEQIIAVTELLAREVAVYINRQGKVIQVAVGDTGTVDLPEIKERTSNLRLSGIRCIHTHPGSDTTLSAPDLSSLRRLRFDVMVALGKKGSDILASMAFFTGEYDDDIPQLQGIGPVEAGALHSINLTYLTTVVDKKLSRDTMILTEDDEERAILAGVELSRRSSSFSAEDSLEELAQLAQTAGAKVVGRVLQKKDRPDSALFMGKGKIQEIAMLLQETNANMVILDDELTPSQQHNLERFLGVKIVDRTALILDIFTQRARSSEGKLQVELAQLRYTLPRIGGQGLILSRLGGGIGTRGPGETKLEVDRRRIYAKIHDIEKQIEKLKKHRTLHRAGRKSSQLPTVALVGYTNAGKSTLLNSLTDADVFAEDKLFATLDPTTRLVLLPGGQKILLTDTVGFIQKLPHHLVSAFHATLEEVQEADLLLHVIDLSQENWQQQHDAVLNVLKELDADQKPTFDIFNKIDKCLEESKTVLGADKAIGISAKSKLHLDELLKKIEVHFSSRNQEMTLLIPYADGDKITELHDMATIRSTEYREDGTLLTVSVPHERTARFEKYIFTLGENN